MRIKTAITKSEFELLDSHLREFRGLQRKQLAVVVDVAYILGCDTDDAWVMLERHQSAREVVARSGCEIAPDTERETIDEEDLCIDRETWRLWAFMAGGFALVLVSIWWIYGG